MKEEVKGPRAELQDTEVKSKGSMEEREFGVLGVRPEVGREALGEEVKLEAEEIEEAVEEVEVEGVEVEESADRADLEVGEEAMEGADLEVW